MGEIRAVPFDVAELLRREAPTSLHSSKLKARAFSGYLPTSKYRNG